jgi:subtilisin family serine protease
VAGIVAAKDNTSAVVGIAPGVSTWSVKVMDSTGFGQVSCIIAGVDWVRQRKAEYNVGLPSGINFRVANMSLGGPGQSSALCNAIGSAVVAGVAFVVAAGNGDADAGGWIPARCLHAVAVSAIADYNGLPGGGAQPGSCHTYGPDDSLATFSNFGSAVELAAPGTCISTTAMGGGTETDFGGTSAAAPHVAGAIVLFLWNGYTGSLYGPTITQAMTSQGWTTPQNSACGFTGDTDGYAEPLLWLAPGCATLSKIFSDVDCSGGVNSTDANKVSSYGVGLPVAQTDPCPDIGPTIKVNGTLRKWGDVDCDGNVNLADAVKIQQYVDGGQPSQNPGCPAFGSSVTIDVVGSL